MEVVFVRHSRWCLEIIFLLNVCKKPILELLLLKAPRRHIASFVRDYANSSRLPAQLHNVVSDPFNMQALGRLIVKALAVICRGYLKEKRSITVHVLHFKSVDNPELVLGLQELALLSIREDL